MIAIARERVHRARLVVAAVLGAQLDEIPGTPSERHVVCDTAANPVAGTPAGP